MKVSELMGKDLVIVYGGDTAKKAAEMMAKHNHGLATVFDNIHDKNIIGVVADKDIIRKVIAKGLSCDGTFVSDIMEKDVKSISPDETTSAAMTMMINENIKRLIVVGNGTLQGILSSNDIIHGMVKYKKELLDLAIDF